MAQPHEEKPLGLQVPAVPHGVEIPPEPPDVGARALSVASRLLAGASTFFFLAFVFAYFYLRSLNVHGAWKPAHVKPEQAFGAIFAALILLSALEMVLAGRRAKRRERSWTVPAAAGLACGLAAIVIQCIEYTVQKFGPTDGAYASVFCAWTACYLLAVLGTMYWLETNLASELRARREPAAAADGDIKDPDRLIAPGLDAAVFFWSFLAAIGLLTWVVLYLL